MSIAGSIGYGPNKTLFFDGEAENFDLWEVKFKAYLRLNKYSKVLETSEEITPEQNAEVFSIMVQILNDKSINLDDFVIKNLKTP